MAMFTTVFNTDEPAAATGFTFAFCAIRAIMPICQIRPGT